jgi:hypothetical protein
MPRLDRLLLGLKGERGDVPGWVLITTMTVAPITCFNTPTSFPGRVGAHAARHLRPRLQGP